MEGIRYDRAFIANTKNNHNPTLEDAKITAFISRIIDGHVIVRECACDYKIKEKAVNNFM